MLFQKIELIGIPGVVQQYARSTIQDEQNKHNISQGQKRPQGGRKIQKKNKQQSHTSNAILKQTIPFCFKNAWYYYRGAIFTFSNKLTEKPTISRDSIYSSKISIIKLRGITEALLKFYYLKTMFYQTDLDSSLLIQSQFFQEVLWLVKNSTPETNTEIRRQKLQLQPNSDWVQKYRQPLQQLTKKNVCVEK